MLGVEGGGGGGGGSACYSDRNRPSLNQSLIFLCVQNMFLIIPLDRGNYTMVKVQIRM